MDGGVSPSSETTHHGDGDAVSVDEGSPSTISDDDLFHHLATHLPPHIAVLDREKQVEFVHQRMSEWRKYQREQEKLKKLYDVYLETVQAHFEPRDMDVYFLENWPFDRALVEALKDGSERALRSILTMVSPDVYTFKVIDASFCDKLLAEVDYFEQWCVERGLALQRPNSMNKYGAILDHFGFYETLQDLMEMVVKPFSAMLYPSVGSALDHHHGFLVSYALGKDVALDFHVDDSEVTLNLCLGKKFTKGNLWFGGRRCHRHQQTPPKSEESFELEHAVGVAVLHAGKHRHLAHPIESGERHNLILWCRNGTYRESVDEVAETPSWCSMCTTK